MRNTNEIHFGIEIECYIPTRTPVRVGSYHNYTGRGRQYVAAFPSFNGQQWHAEGDTSLNSAPRGYKGVEFVSPKMKGKEGMENVLAVLRVLNEWNARVNRTCGLHVSVSVEDGHDTRAVERLVYQFAHHEKAIFASTGTKTRETGMYSQSIKSFIHNTRRESLAYSIAGHGLSVNFGSVHRGRVEFRAFAGTLNAVKMFGHISMAIALVQRAESTTRRTGWNRNRRAVETTKQGQSALNHFFSFMGWTKGVNANQLGIIADVDGAPTIKELKKELRRLAKKYDAR